VENNFHIFLIPFHSLNTGDAREIPNFLSRSANPMSPIGVPARQSCPSWRPNCSLPFGSS
jgi:hypothetical protein